MLKSLEGVFLDMDINFFRTFFSFCNAYYGLTAAHRATVDSTAGWALAFHSGASRRMHVQPCRKRCSYAYVAHKYAASIYTVDRCARVNA